MPREWYADCKDCGKRFGYSDDSQRLSSRRGLSRPERCPECRRKHAAEINTVGLSHFEMAPVSEIPPTGLSAGRLGGLQRPPRVHEPQDKERTFDLNKFGIKDAHIRGYFDLMQKKQVTVIVAPTGAGKSTFLPYRLMAPPEPLRGDLFTRRGQIIVTQPRIQATRNIPLFVARDLHGSNLGAGFDVGFRHSGNPATDWRNKLVYMTDGTLINMIVRGELGRVSVIMIDEAHERSLNIDLILGLLRTQLARYPHLKLIIASATINAGLFLQYYGGPQGFDPDKYATDSGEGFLNYDNDQIALALSCCPVGFYGFPGKRQYPVEERPREGEPIPDAQWTGRMPDEMAAKILELLRNIQSGVEPVRGDILGFLHGEEPIERCVKLIRAGVDDEPALAGKVDVLPLYTKLPQKQQDAALLPKKSKDRLRVVISTNVAETSLTVDGIVHVVDSGLINESKWDPKTQTSFVEPRQHSQAGCKQRWGRAGRVQAGVAHWLYTREQFARFPKHTDPEILRAPLDQIVLTAKAAGIDDIEKFEWIQRPSVEELKRAPHYLQQIGAIDAEGFLTDHGLELRSYAEEVDIANLMILADRFGCAVEMATLLPMRKLGGYTSLLMWDRNWDAPTKRAVHRVHESLLRPCVDDLEFSLKIWQAWEGRAFGRSTDNQRAAWASRCFVNHQVLLTQVAVERRSLLDSLSGHKKELTYRPIDFDLLTRLRMLMVYGLPTQIYQLAQPAGAGQLDQVPVYQPYIADAQANPALVQLHKGATVEITPDSVCYGAAVEAFVCGTRQRTRRRVSPLSEPLTIITAAFVVAIRPEWVQVINRPVTSLATAIAAQTRALDGSLLPTTAAARLFIDQIAPIGATYLCRVSADRQLEIGALVAPAPAIQPRNSNEDVEGPDDIELLAPEGEISSTGISEEDEKYIVEAPADELPEQDWDDEAQVGPVGQALRATQAGAPQPALQAAAPASVQARQPVEQAPAFPGRLAALPLGLAAGATVEATVAGYELDGQAPAIRMELRTSPTPFERFVQAGHKVGSTLNVVVAAVEQYVNDRLAYLVVKDEASGLEIILDPYDASLGGRNFPIQVLNPGDRITVTIEELDTPRQRVRATRLRQAEADLLAFTGNGEERVLPGRIADVRDNGLDVWLDPENNRALIPISAFVYIDRLPLRPDEMYLGQACKVSVRPSQWRKELRRGIGEVGKHDLDRLRSYGWDPKLRLDEDGRTLVVGRRMTYIDRMRLLGLCQRSDYQRAVNILFRRSNELDVRIVDVTAIQNLAQYQGSKAPGKWQVRKVLDDGLFVAAPDGFEGFVPKHEACYDPNKDLHAALPEGTQVEVTVREANPDKGQIELSLLDPAKDPLNRYQPGQIVRGVVTNVNPKLQSGWVGIEPGLEGMVHKSEAAWWRVASIEEALQPGQPVRAMILEIDRVQRRLRLTLRLPETDPLRSYRVGQIIEGKVVGFAPKNAGAFVELTLGAEGFVYREEITGRSVQDVRAFWKEGDQVRVRVLEIDVEQRRMRLTAWALYEERISVPATHMALVIGPQGKTINTLSEETRTTVDLDDDGLCTISGQRPEHVKVARQRIEAILRTRVVTFRIQDTQVGRLVGRGGETIKGITTASGAQIQVVEGGQVIVTAADDRVLADVLGRIRQAVSYYQATVQVSPSRVGRVIGAGGQTIAGIRNATGTRLDVAKDNSGRITIEGPTRAEVEQAITYINSYAGGSVSLSSLEAGMPIPSPLRAETMPPRKPRATRQEGPIPSRMTALPPPAPMAVASPPPAPRLQPQAYRVQVQVSPARLSQLERRQGGFFVTLFGGGKSVLDQIRENTGAELRVNSTTGVITVVARTQDAATRAVKEIQQAT